MEYVRFAVKFASFALVVLLVGGYCYLVYAGVTFRSRTSMPS